MTKAWLAELTWDWVTALNAQLCKGGRAFHGPTSDGHEQARSLWETEYAREMSLEDAVELCRRCHKIAPFCFFNGNTFAAAIKVALQSLPEASAIQKHLLMTLSGHIVAGTSTPEEELEFQKLLGKIV